MGYFLYRCLLDFFVAFGVVIGATMLTGICAILTLRPPTVEMLSVAENIKIWAIVAAIGGTIDPFRVIESNIFHGEQTLAIQQIMYILSAFMGAQFGTRVIQWICSGGVQS
jgi:hypothetical protein